MYTVFKLTKYKAHVSEENNSRHPLGLSQGDYQARTSLLDHAQIW